MRSTITTSVIPTPTTRRSRAALKFGNEVIAALQQIFPPEIWELISSLELNFHNDGPQGDGPKCQLTYAVSISSAAPGEGTSILVNGCHTLSGPMENLTDGYAAELANHIREQVYAALKGENDRLTRQLAQLDTALVSMRE